MNYKSYAEHTEYYKINGKPVKVTANFVANKLFIGSQEYPLSDYDNYEGDMESYVINKLAK